MRSDYHSKRVVFIASGVFGILAVFMPLTNLNPPPVLKIDLENAGFSELLAFPGVGLKHASAIREREVLKILDPDKDDHKLPAPAWISRIKPFVDQDQGVRPRQNKFTFWRGP